MSWNGLIEIPLRRVSKCFLETKKITWTPSNERSGFFLEPNRSRSGTRARDLLTLGHATQHQRRNKNHPPHGSDSKVPGSTNDRSNRITDQPRNHWPSHRSGHSNAELLDDPWKGPFYQTALTEVGSYYTIKTRPLEDDSYWQMVHVNSQTNEQKFIPENAKKYVASGLSVMKISQDESNLFYEYAAPKSGIYITYLVIFCKTYMIYLWRIGYGLWSTPLYSLKCCSKDALQLENPWLKPYQRNLYWTKNLADDKTSEEICITCNLDDEKIDEITKMSSCWWKDFTLQRTSDDEESYVFFVNCRGPGIPKTFVTKIQIKDDATEMANHLNSLRNVCQQMSPTLLVANYLQII